MKNNSPCFNCPHRKATCHDYCREYIEWHEDKLMAEKARAFDRFMELVANEIIYKSQRRTR